MLFRHYPKPCSVIKKTKMARHLFCLVFILGLSSSCHSFWNSRASTYKFPKGFKYDKNSVFKENEYGKYGPRVKYKEPSYFFKCLTKDFFNGVFNKMKFFFF